MLSLFECPISVVNLTFTINKTKNLVEFFFKFLSFLDLVFFIGRNILTLKFPLYAMSYLFFFFKKNMILRYTQLSDICCIDTLQVNFRFMLKYYLLSFFNNIRLCLFCFVNDLSYIPSLSFLFKSSCWYEREI